MTTCRTPINARMKNRVFSYLLQCLSFSVLFQVVDSAQGKYAQMLLHNLLQDYSNALRPVEDTDKALNVTLQITLSQIKDMDERNQILTAYLWIRQTWYDAYLKWDKDDYDGLDSIRIPSNLVWRPDIVLYNNSVFWGNACYGLNACQSIAEAADWLLTEKKPATMWADDEYSGPVDTNVVLRYDGQITWDSPAITKSSCVVDVSYFPFDNQQCNLTFGSWTYNGNQIDIDMGMDSGDLSDFVENVEWECHGMPAAKNVITYGCCSDPYPDITYTLLLKRRSSFYIFNLLIPCVMISFLAPLGFYLPADSGEKVSLGVTVLLALTVFQLMVAESMPPSESVPLIGKYYIATMTMITASTALTIFIMNIHHCGAEAKPVPDWAKVFILDYMSKIFFVYEVGENCTTSQKEKEKEVKLQMKENVNAKGEASTCHNKYNVSAVDKPNGHPNGDLKEERSPENINLYMCTCAHHDKITKNIEYIANCFREQKATCAKGAEWKKVAKVMDRFFMWVFFIMVFLMSISIIR